MLKEKNETMHFFFDEIQLVEGWEKEVNIVSWNDSTTKLDIRDWDPEHMHMSRGITLHKEEAEVLLTLLSKEFLDGK